MVSAAEEPQFPEGVKISYHLPVEMRDGVALATDVYLPSESGGPYPTLLVRDIYGNGAAEVRQRYARLATSHGYAFVLQVCRGRYDSDGNWYPYFQEINDGDDVLSWIAEQSWSNGKVGMFGSSYLGSVQWLAALNDNPALVAIAPSVSPGNYYRDVAYPGGAFSLLSRASWGIGLTGSRTIMSYPISWETSVDHLPLKTLDQSLGFNVRHFQDWLAHPTLDSYWRPLNLEDRADEMSVPALNIGGWYDAFLRSTIGSYVTMTNDARSQVARENQRLVIGPWPHGWNRSSRTGDLDFGEAALVDWDALHLDWFEIWLKDGEKKEVAPVRIFVMGENVWRDEYEWPLARTENTSFYFQEDGSLSVDLPADSAEPMLYTYDPADPVPTVGGNIMRTQVRGPRDQRPLDEREDIVRFTTEAFSEKMEITGPLTVNLYASSSAPDTDFMAKLVVVRPDGFSFNLADGVIRARYREGFEEPKLITPGEPLLYTIDVWATSYVVQPGERLRVDITSSNFPRLDRNPNTGAPFGETTHMVPADQTLYLDAERPSHIVLPVIPKLH
ncbi:CocE/NonD family hydrolase [Pelagicoccus sp. SDUM812002]|uniref:CocE/NonD family hydrolase n=1 Tax=Pelagicoccus sp. SDUM812002 TaxID=3041266 RepID=UPI00280E7E14|nr:CocE/NonD family hydrolase [Pelagicoccus sp. SDUM812002]MDQ8184343.1 CocE/NonD family hydrolase [Pelagicoccus sp. SDUM812002]